MSRHVVECARMQFNRGMHAFDCRFNRTPRSELRLFTLNYFTLFFISTADSNRILSKRTKPEDQNPMARLDRSLSRVFHMELLYHVLVSTQSPFLTSFAYDE